MIVLTPAHCWALGSRIVSTRKLVKSKSQWCCNTSNFFFFFSQQYCFTVNDDKSYPYKTDLRLSLHWKPLSVEPHWFKQWHFYSCFLFLVNPQSRISCTSKSSCEGVMGGKLTGSILHSVAVPGAALAKPQCPLLLLTFLPLNWGWGGTEPIACKLCLCWGALHLHQLSSPTAKQPSITLTCLSPLHSNTQYFQGYNISKDIDLLAKSNCSKQYYLWAFQDNLLQCYTNLSSLIVKILIRWKMPS